MASASPNDGGAKAEGRDEMENPPSFFRIEGGVRLRGTIRPQGNKNAALPLLASALLSEEPLRLKNVPNIGDVWTMLALLEAIGVRVERLGPHDVVLHAKGEISPRPPAHLAGRLRSVVLAGPLLARCGWAFLPRPGGDRIGRRRIDPHLKALAALGAEVEGGPQGYTLRAPKGLRGTFILLEEASVTATESTIMAASLARGETVIYHAACEPHVQELCRSLNARGARIEGIGTNRLVIEGVERLGGEEHILEADYQEIGTFIGLAAATGSEVRILDIPWAHLPVLRRGFDRLGVRLEQEGEALLVPREQELRIQEDYDGAIPQIDDAPWPGFPSDLLSIALVTATQARGTVLFHEKMFESRLFFVDRLIEMGARIVLCDPHRCVVSGPSQLYGMTLSSPDIRAGMALLIAALCARGVTVIHNIAQIDRGYECIEKRLQALGASIERLPGGAEEVCQEEEEGV